MYKAKFTKAGAKRMGVPELAGMEFEYDRIVPPHNECVDSIYYKGKRIGGTLSFVGDDAGCVLITKPK